MRTFFCLLVLAALLCTGCAEPMPLKLTAPFEQAKSEQMMRRGQNTIIVKTFTKGYYGGSIYECAGLKTFLFPATERIAEYIKLVIGSVAGGQVRSWAYNSRISRIENDDPNSRV